MRLILIFFLALFTSIQAIGHADSIFSVSRGIVSDSLRIAIDALKKKNVPLFEDEYYVVTGTCSGEWGGTVKFKNKKTGVEYSSAATCPVSINKMNDKFYVTCSLAHMGGSCDVKEITNPDSMEVYKVAPPRKINGKKVKYVGDDESKSTQGTKTLVSEYGKRILASFIFDGTLFHIVTERRRSRVSSPITYIANIENEKFKMVKYITDEDVFTYDADVIKTSAGHLFIPILGGYLDVVGREIKILK